MREASLHAYGARANAQNVNAHAPAHLSHIIQEFWARHGMERVRPFPNTPDMVPCDLWLSLTMPVKGTRFWVIKGDHQMRRDAATDL